MDGPPAQWSCWPTTPIVGTPVIIAQKPPSCVFWPPAGSLPVPDAMRFTPSPITMYCWTGANGALSTGSVKLVVVAVAAGRQLVSPGFAPSGW